MLNNWGHLHNAAGCAPDMVEGIVCHAPTGIFIFDLIKHQHIYVNQKQTDLTGYTLAELQSTDQQGYEQLFHSEDVWLVREHIRQFQTMPDGKSIATNYRYRVKDGHWVWFRSHCSVFRRAEDGAPTQILGFFHDISREKEIENELVTIQAKAKQSFEQMVSILEGLDVVVYVADMETYEILYLNQHAKGLFGDKVGSICWQTLQSNQTGPCDFCTNDYLVDCRGQSTGPHNWNFENTRLGMWYNILDKAITWIDGRTVRLEIATDISAMKMLEIEKLNLIASLERALAEVDTLQGIIPICSFCKKIRDDAGYWEMVESYISKNSSAEFSHGICPDCMKENYPEY